LKICRISTFLALVCVLAGSVFGQTASKFLPANSPADKSVSGGASVISDSISDLHGTTFSSDGTCLFYRYWIPSGEPDPEYVVLLLHGIGLHSGRYGSTAQELNKSGIGVYAVDTRGHGLSCGKRGFIPTIARENRDISAMLAAMRQLHPNAKIFLMAESMGGIFALNYALTNPTDLSGMILMSPVFKLARGQYWHWGALRLFADLAFRPNAPVVDLAPRFAADSGKNSVKPAAANQSQDTLAYTRVSINYLMGIHKAILHWQIKAPQVHVATLVMEGEHDPVAKPGSVQQLFDLLATNDKKFSLCADVTHSLLGNPHSPDILHGVSAWIAEH
jgi:alpha-beta hydrolase superfamily lysophospholipase